jgi:hypothetical protein
MKVNAPTSTSIASGARRTTGGAAPGFVLPGQVEGGPAQVNRARSATSIANVGALLALQGEDDVVERRRRATRRSSTLLDQLDEIRVAILGGGVSRDQVARLSQTLREHRDAVDDPALNALLDDVELRAEVELAKLERAL